ncbi:hypothetical protein ACO2Q3_16450 [Caulobacter sp. KR2-114]|uniref:hypothetical protein n=1 Tax=Caulobacter sp. KR2-114 TaxID=3400912 RepID=UPI003BFBF764
MARPPEGFSRPAGFRFPRWAVVSVVGAGIIIVLGLSLYDRFLNVRDATQESQASAIAGPPCPSISHDAVLRDGLEVRYATDFNGLSFGRRFGEVSCSEVAAKGGLGMRSYPVCQFSGPDVVSVKTAAGQLYFRPGVGRKASIVVQNGAPRCVMAAPDWS